MECKYECKVSVDLTSELPASSSQNSPTGGSTGERQTLAGGFDTPEVTANSFQNSLSDSSICDNPEILRSELCGQAASSSMNYSMQFRSNSGLTGAEATCAILDSSSVPFSATLLERDGVKKILSVGYTYRVPGCYNNTKIE